MIRRLCDLGYLDAVADAHCNVSIRLDNLLVDVFDSKGRHYHLRMAEAYDMHREYQIAETVTQAWTKFVPRPLHFFREGAVSGIVFEGLRFSAVSTHDLLRSTPARLRLLPGDLIEFFCISSTAMVGKANPLQFAGVLADLNSRYLGTEHEALFLRVLAATDLERMAGLPARKQHGDFVMNNLGIRSSGLVVFDWEDFGKICLPGFDLAVLAASMIDFDPHKLRRLRALGRSASRAYPRWLADACRAMDLECSEFWRSVPFHLLIFLWLKDRYSSAIRQRVTSAIEGLLRDE